MNPGSLPSHGRTALSFQAMKWPQQMEVWRDLLAQCTRKPSRRHVHALRSLTLRLRTTLEHQLLEQAPEPAAAQAFKRWKKVVKKLRRRLEPVRNADVYLARLDSLRKASGKAAGVEAKLSSRCRSEMDKLETRLKRRRQTGANKLIAVLETGGNRLNRISREMESALTPRMLSRTDSTAQTALQIFAGLVTELPHLDNTNLHIYRKRLKPALYLAESSATDDPLARRLAMTFRKMHLAIGEWHDWQSLALEADHILPSHNKPDGLLPLLEEITAASFKKALGLCQRSTARFLKSAAAHNGQETSANP
jgi:hypothetical protein